MRSYERFVKRRAILRAGLGVVFFTLSLTAAGGQTLTPTIPTIPQTVPTVSMTVEPLVERQVTLDFNNVDIPILIKFISELTGKNFIIDENVRGKVTIFSPKKILAGQAYDVLLSVLEMKGFSVVVDGNVHKVLPSPEAIQDSTIHMYPLEHVEAEKMAKLLLGMATPAQRPRGRMNLPIPGAITGAVRIVPDRETNSLLITASDHDFNVLKDLIKKLDKRKRQVYVEAVIMEMGEEKTRQLGGDLSAIAGYHSEKLGALLLGGLNANPPSIAEINAAQAGLPAGVRFPKGQITEVLKALQSDNDVNVLSTPQLLAGDGEKAEIVVAQNVPFPGSQTTSTGGNIQTTIERKDVGITLKLTPTVLKDDLVKLDIYQEASSLTPTPQTVGNNVVIGPTTNKRSATTIVTVPDGQTVVIGGLIRDDVVEGEKKIPLLGDIPLLGWLFKTKTHEVRKTNMLIFITPHVVKDSEGLGQIATEKVDGAEDFMAEYQPKGAKQRLDLMKESITVPDQATTSGSDQITVPATVPDQK